MARAARRSSGRSRFRSIHIDTSYKFKEIYEFRDRIAKEWNLDLRIARNEEALADGMGPKKIDKFACCNALKTTALKQAIAQARARGAAARHPPRRARRAREGALLLAARAGFHAGTSAAQPPELWDLYATVDEAAHDRIHPLLHMTELDIWRYVRREGMPSTRSTSRRTGKRYRSHRLRRRAACRSTRTRRPSTRSSPSSNRPREPERAGRAQDKENAFTMQKLRSLGYM